MLDQFERGRILLSGVDILVIDEADRMLDMGFIPDIERICGLLPPRRQTLFFSATMPPEIERLTKRFLRDPVKIEVARQNSTAETIDQRLVRVSSKPEEKRAVLRQLIRAEGTLTNAIIFCNRKRDVATLARSLERHGFSAGALHGDMDQKSRMETLDAFKGNRLTLLVASDVAARGLDIPAVSHVFNFDVPTHAEDYIHRIGRTGRAGRSGISVTLAQPSDGKYLDAIVKLIQKDIPEVGKVVIESREDDEERDEKPALKSAARGRRGRQSRGERRPQEAASAEVRQESPGGERPREEKPREERQNSRRPEPAATAPSARQPVAPRKPNPPRKPSGESPFGNDGPVPAFLLRPGRTG
jgi:superfamily II DNA/RNA helicase